MGWKARSRRRRRWRSIEESRRAPSPGTCSLTKSGAGEDLPNQTKVREPHLKEHALRPWSLRPRQTPQRDVRVVHPQEHALRLEAINGTGAKRGQSQSGTSPGTCSSTGDQASRNTRNSYSYIWSNQDQDASFLFIYIHLLLSLLFSKVININQSEEITSDFTLFLSVI